MASQKILVKWFKLNKKALTVLVSAFCFIIALYIYHQTTARRTKPFLQ